MSLFDKLSAGAERAAKEAEKAFDKGKAKVGELQIEMQMDGMAKKLGYLVFDFYRGRQVDQAQRQKLLDDLSRLEDQLIQARTEAAAKAQAAATAAGAAASAGTTPGPDAGPSPGSASSEAPPSGSTSPGAEAGDSGSADSGSSESEAGPVPENEETWPQADA